MTQSRETLPQGLYHILMWTYKSAVPAEERARLEAELEELPRKVPSLRAMQWGRITGGRNQSFSHSFVMLFDDKHGLEEYQTHPDHLHFSGPFREACEMQVVVDFEC